MVIRKLIEATEEKILAPWAQKSAAAVREHEAVVEEQHRSPRQRTDDTHDPRLDIFVRVHDVIHDQRHGRAERRNDRGVDGRGVGGSPEQHVHPTVDN